MNKPPEALLETSLKNVAEVTVEAWVEAEAEVVLFLKTQLAALHRNIFLWFR